RFGPAGETRRGVALTIHVEDEQAVEHAHADVSGFDDVGELDAEPTRSGWGYGFGFCDPEGNVWGVAVKFGSRFDDRGASLSPCPTRSDGHWLWTSGLSLGPG